MRWEHPERGPIPPAEFIPLAEHTGLIHPLTLHVLDRALAQCRAWHDEGFGVGVAVNVSAQNLVAGELPGDVARLLAKWELSPAALKLEITESTIMGDPVRARQILEDLQAMGVTLAIDDFGTGHSSLAYLKRLPVHELKIERSFVMNMASSSASSGASHAAPTLRPLSVRRWKRWRPQARRLVCGLYVKTSPSALIFRKLHEEREAIAAERRSDIDIDWDPIRRSSRAASAFSGRPSSPTVTPGRSTSSGQDARREAPSRLRGARQEHGAASNGRTACR